MSQTALDHLFFGLSSCVQDDTTAPAVPKEMGSPLGATSFDDHEVRAARSSANSINEHVPRAEADDRDMVVVCRAQHGIRLQRALG